MSRLPHRQILVLHQKRHKLRKKCSSVSIVSQLAVVDYLLRRAEARDTLEERKSLVIKSGSVPLPGERPRESHLELC